MSDKVILYLKYFLSHLGLVNLFILDIISILYKELFIFIIKRDLKGINVQLIINYL